MTSLRAIAVVLCIEGVGHAAAPGAEALSFAERASLPSWVAEALGSTARVAPCACLNPFYQRGDRTKTRALLSTAESIRGV
jgi:hypothetical protein